MSRSKPTYSIPGRVAGPLAIGLTWLVTALVVAFATRSLRAQIREQIIGRDAQVLLTMARTLTPVENVDETLAHDPFATLVSIARVDTILAAWLFDEDGNIETALPAAARDVSIPSEAWDKLRQFQPFSRFLPSLALTNVFMSTNLLEFPVEAAIPAMEVFVPLGKSVGGGPQATAAFLMEAGSVATEFDRLDRRLLAQTGVLVVAAMILTGLILGWAFHRLHRTHALLGHRTEDLQRANQELSQSARIAALGAVTAHLVHGLRNPVSGLQSFIAARPSNGEQDDEAWGEAREATQRMHVLIQQVVAVIREQSSDLPYELSLREACERAMGSVRARARSREIDLSLEGDPRHWLDNRECGLFALLAQNLLDNAIDATPRGGSVRIRIALEAARAVCDVIDEGAGVSAAARERLFQPQRSTKEGGSGVGLAIARQLGLALGGDVRLVGSGDSGSTFRVELPVTAADPRAGCVEAAVSATRHE